MADPETAADNDFALMLLELARAYKNCERKQADLAAFIKDGKP